jgi:hypothetical protein
MCAPFGAEIGRSSRSTPPAPRGGSSSSRGRRAPGPDEFLDQTLAEGDGRTRFRLVTTSARHTDHVILIWRSTEPGLKGGHLRLDIPPRP